MKFFNIFAIFNGLAWLAIAIAVLGNMCGWWIFNFPEGSAFCACLICSMSFFYDLMKENN